MAGKQCFIHLTLTRTCSLFVYMHTQWIEYWNKFKFQVIERNFYRYLLNSDILKNVKIVTHCSAENIAVFGLF